MYDKSPKIERHPLRALVGAIGLVVVIGAGVQIPGQIAHYNETTPHETDVNLDPLTWLSGPVADFIEHFEHH